MSKRTDIIIDPDGTRWKQLDAFANEPKYRCRFCGYPCKDATMLCDHVAAEHRHDRLYDRAAERCVPNGFQSLRTRT